MCVALTLTYVLPLIAHSLLRESHTPLPFPSPSSQRREPARLLLRQEHLCAGVRAGVPGIPHGAAVLRRTGECLWFRMHFGVCIVLCVIQHISYGAAVHWVLNILDINPDIKADVIDLRTLQPLDTETIYNSVKKTGKAIILQEDSLFGGIASDISALIMEECFEWLDAPVKRVASIETPIPFITQLEEQYLPKNRFEQELKALLNY